MKLFSCLLLAGCLPALSIACHRAPSPPAETGRKSTMSPSPQKLTTITLHIHGFKKSKSGAT